MIVLVALVIVTPALADYVGPNRTVTETKPTCKITLNECQFVAAKNDYRFKSVNQWSCSNETKPWQEYPSNPPRDCFDQTVGDQYWERDESPETVITTYPPATINSSLENCTLQNGWCVTLPYLALNGSEPVTGHNIIAIEGYLNEQNFACINSSCNVPLNQGSNSFSYWALSSFGDSSLMGALTANVDSQLPNITGTLSGTAGSNGWYTSSVSFKGSATDATSGLAHFTCTLDGIPLGSCSTVTVNSNGLHTLVLTAQDNAGHIRTLTQNAPIDTQNPLLTASISGALGSNNWYTDARLSATASDPSPGSGLSALQYNLDGSGWIPFPASGTLPLMDGKHTVDLRALDYAGRIVTSSKSFWLDKAAPNLILDPAGTLGLNDWYTTSLTIAASANDETSGIDNLDYSLNNADWQAYASPLSLSDGVHSLSMWAQDEAGLVTQVDRTYRVDTRLPQMAGTLSGTPGANGWYVSDVTLSATASDPTPGSGIESFTYILDKNSEISYTDPVILPDGQHTVQFNARDKAGLLYSIEQNIKVDTIPPSLNVEITFHDWVKNSLILTGTADDGGSGLSKVEISLDGAKTWKQVVATDSKVWNYTWDTLKIANEVYQVNIRATDHAGLTTQHTFDVGVDNQAPEISLPASWFQWDTVTLDIWDDHSGLSAASVEIIDPEGRWTKRVINLNPKQFPLSFKWDRRFGDDAVAEPGTYDVKVTASDSLGNTTTKNASINILLDILPPGPTSTPQQHIRPEPTRTPSYVAAVTPTITAAQTAIVSTFGVIEPSTLSTPTSQALPTPRSTPTQSSVQDWLESVFVPGANEASTIIIGPGGDSGEASQPALPDNSMVLWGTAATAAIAAATAYAREEKRKLEEERARQAELEREKEERQERIKERKLEKAEAKRAQEQAWEEARIEQEALEGFQGLAARARQNNELRDWEMQEEANWIASQEAIRKRYEDKKAAEEEKKKKAQELQAGLEAYYNGRKEGEKESEQPKTNWWEQTKSFVSENIIQPVDQSIYQPYIKPVIEFRNEVVSNAISWWDETIYQPHIIPAVERSKEFITNETSWINEHLYQPFVKPIVEKINDEVAKGINWANEEVYQPYVKPGVEKVIQNASNNIKWLNEEIYQPFVKPAVEILNENIYQPYLEPIVENIVEEATKTVSWVNENIYQPYLEPVVSDITEHVYQPLATQVTDWWNEYGEWVHAALDVAGFIPGFGEIADGINGLVYLAEGRYLEASLSVVSMIPILGDLGKAGKWTADALDTVVGTVVKGVAGESIEKAAKEMLEEGTEKLVKESGDWVHTGLDMVGCLPGAGTHTTTLNTVLYLAEGRVADATISAVSMVPIVGDVFTLGKELAENSYKKLVKEAAEAMQDKTTKEILEAGTETAIKELKEEAVQKITKETVEAGTQKVFKEVGEEVAEKTTKDVFTETIENTVVKVQKELKEDTFIEQVTSENTGSSSIIIPDTIVEEIVQITPKQFDKETTQRVLNEVIEGKVIKLPSDISAELTTENASELAATISEELGGMKVWVSAKTGSIYVSSPPPEGFVLAEQLSRTDLTNKDEVEKILRRVAELTSRGSGDHVVLGPFKPNGRFIQEALDTNGVFWDVGDELWEALEKTGIDMFNANDQFIRVHIDNGINRFDVIDVNVNKVINEINNGAPRDWTSIKYTEKEILDLASMPDIPYQLVDNSWVKVDLTKSTN